MHQPNTLILILCLQDCREVKNFGDFPLLRRHPCIVVTVFHGPLGNLQTLVESKKVESKMSKKTNVTNVESKNVERKNVERKNVETKMSKTEV